MSPIGYGLGIDLGTANTCTAVFRDNVTHIVPHNGQNTMPSCVAFTDTCRLVGSAAKAQASANPTNTIFDALRYVGKDFSDPGLRHMTENVPFKVKQEYGRTTFIVEYQGRELVTTPLDILAMVLARAQRDAQNFLGPRIQSSGAIITIPANFNFRQRQVIWDAACLAKINPIRLMSAATATFADYALKTQSTKLRNVLCVDLGAGSLDVAIAIFEFGLAEIKAVNGNNFLDESENLDSLLVNFAASQFRQKWGLDPRKEPRPLRRLRTACEQAKHDLTFQKDTHLFIDNLAGGHDFEFSFKQEIMESCCFNLFKSSLELIRKTLEDARMDSTQIDAVLVTGGLSRMPKFLSLLSQVIDEHKIYKLFNRDEAAARGAAYYAAIILKTVSSELDDFLLIDVAPFSLGIETTENKIEKVLRKNASVPSKKYTDFTTLEQDSYSVSIFEGEQSLARSNLFLARFELPLDTGRSDKATIEVCVSYSTNIDVLVIAKDTKTGKQGQVRLADYLMLPEHELKIKTGEHLEFDTTERHEETRIGARNAAEEYVVSLLDKLATSPDTVATTAKKSLANDLLEWLDVNPGAQEHVFRRKTNILKTRIISVVDVDARTKQSFEQMSPKATRGPAPPFSSPDVSSHPFPDHNNATSIPDSRYEEVLREALEEPLFEPSQASPNSKNELQSESEITHQLNELNAQQTKIDASVSPPLPGSGALGNSDATTTSRVTSPHPRESGINDLFMRASTERFVYTDAEFVHVSAYLRNSGQPAWSTVPRLYTVLRLLDQLYTLDTFIEQGITDIWFPFTATSLPNAISPTLRGKFLDQQQVVLSKSLLFENSSDRKHAHFAQGEPLPFHIIAKLGSGAHGQVDKVMSTVSHREYARKQFRRQRGTSKDAIKSFLIELQVLKRVHHHHCIELMHSYTDPKFFALLMSPVGECNLYEYYDLARSSPDKLSLLRSFFGCLASALQYVHSIKIRHRDIKPQNVLVKGDKVYLTDFGIALDWEDLSRSTTTADSGKTLVYAAPEVAQYEKRNTSADVWSLGCVFLEMATVLKGETIATMRSFFQQRSGNYRFYANIENLGPWAQTLRVRGAEKDNTVFGWARGMLEKEGNERPTASELYEDIVKECAMQHVPFCGACCVEEEGSDDVFDTDEDDLWEQAAELTIVPESA